MAEKREKRSGWRIFWCVVRRFFLLVFTLTIIAAVGLYMVCDLVFNGPSPNARDRLTMSMRESSAMKWFPAVFLGDEKVAEIEKSVDATLPAEVSDGSLVKIDLVSSAVDGEVDEWEGHPDGIRIENIKGDTYNAYIMIIRDPSRVYQATSHLPFSYDVPGERINVKIEQEGAVAAINAGAFLDMSGTSQSHLTGRVPAGLVIAGGEVVFNDHRSEVPEAGFVGFNNDDVLVVAQSMTPAKAMDLGIRDGCEFGPVLIINGQINEEAYNGESGLNPRTCIGQRADGAVIFLCVEGRAASSLGATYADLIDIMVEYGAVNACNLDGGSSTVMMYRDPETGEVSMVNNYSLLQEEPRRMPTFFMVKPHSGD